MMNISIVSHQLEEIRAVASDDEQAHSLEDELHRAVLGAIADGSCVDPVACARLALTSKNIEFERWCA